MNSIVIAANIRLTHIKVFCDSVKGMSGIFLPIKINHLTPELCILGAIDAFLGMNLNLSHGGVVWLTCSVLQGSHENTRSPVTVSRVSHQVFILSRIHCVFQCGHQTIEVFGCRKNTSENVDQITILFAEFIQILFAVGVTIVGVDAHDRFGVVNESNIRHENRMSQ